jgi:hypothetical protein
MQGNGKIEADSMISSELRSPGGGIILEGNVDRGLITGSLRMRGCRDCAAIPFRAVRRVRAAKDGH